MRWSVIFAFAALVSKAVFSQNLDFVRYGQNEGLKHSQVFDIAQDDNSNLWLTTASYFIYRFDGRQFFQYKISLDNYTGRINSYKIAADDHQIWVLTNIGLVKFDGRRFTLIPTDEKWNLSFNSKLHIDKRNRLWIVDEEGELFRVTDEKIERQINIRKKAGGPIIDICENGNTIFFSKNDHLVELNESHEISSKELDWLDDEEWSAIFISEADFYVGSQGKIVHYNSNGKKIISLPKEVKGAKVTRIIKDRYGVVWVLAGGVIISIKEGKAELIRSNKFPKNFVFSLFLDKSRSAWMATDAEGLFNYRSHSFSKLLQGEGEHIMSMTFVGNDSAIVMGTYKNGVLGLASNMLEGKLITSCDGGIDDLIVGTHGNGLYRVKKAIATPITIGKGFAQFIGAVRRKGNSMFIGSLSGLHVISEAEIENYKFPGNEKGGAMGVSSIYPQNDSVVLIGCEFGGLFVFKNKKLTRMGPAFLEGSTVYSVKEGPDKDILVTGEFSKIFVFDSALTLKYSVDLSNWVSNILFIEWIAKGRFVIGSNEGVFQVTVEKDKIKSVRKYGRMDGYDDEEVYVNSSLKKQNGSIVFGTVSGAYMISPEDAASPISIPKTYLTELRLTDQSALNNESPKSAEYFGLPVSPSLPYNTDAITFGFSGTDLENPYNIQFHYKLSGVDRSWSPLSVSNHVTYSNLKHGNYIFQVQAIGESKSWGSIASYSFRIHPAWWQTSWFYMAMVFGIIVFAVLSIWITSNYRLSQSRLREEVRAMESIKIRKQMSMDFHDEMGNKLASMLAQASLLKVKHKEGELFKIFDFFERNSFAIYHGTKDFIWTIDVTSNNLREVVSYLMDFGFNFFERNGISFHFANDITAPHLDVKLKDGHNRHIILIFKEAMTNALKHSRCNNVYFSVQVVGQQCSIELKDDGNWADKHQSGKGLKNMHTRASKIGGALIVENDTKGTKINLSFKIV